MRKDCHEENTFDSVPLGHRILKNRLWRSATWMALADNQGHLTDDIIAAYDAIAAGGVALIHTGLTSVGVNDFRLGGEIRFYDDSFIDDHRRLTGTVHKHDCLILMQTALVDGSVDELSVSEVEHVVNCFGKAAQRAQQAGYDGVQIHAAHFFFLSKFISPLFNHRTDRYGGSQHRRTRILCEILESMRANTGKDFCITMKVNSSDEYAGGMTTQDFIETCSLMAASGIDAIEVSANGTSRTGIRTGVNEGCFFEAARQLSQVSSAPVALVGGLRSVDYIQQMLDSSQIAYASLSRPLIREPDLVNRWKAGDTSPSRCISCNSCYHTPGHVCLFNQ